MRRPQHTSHHKHLDAQAKLVDPTEADRNHSFNTTMHYIRRELSLPERIFSRITHSPIIEPISDILSKTIARPSGILGAALSAAFGLLVLYSMAKFAGFSLSGSEFPLLFVVGFILGILVELVHKIFVHMRTPK